jgi:hypothetical protein
VLAAAKSKAAARREAQKPAIKVAPKVAAKRKQPDSKGVWHVTHSMHATQNSTSPMQCPVYFVDACQAIVFPHTFIGLCLGIGSVCYT